MVTLIVLLSVLAYFGAAFGTIRFCTWFFDDAAKYLGALVTLSILWPAFWLLFAIVISSEWIKELVDWRKVGKKIAGLK